MAARLTSVDELKTELRIPAAETAYDSLFGDLIEEVSRECEEHCDRVFTEADYENEQHRGGVDSIVVRNWPITDPDNVTVEVTGLLDSEITEEFDADDFIVQAETGIIRLKGGLRFPSGPRGTVLVSYSGGYPEIGTTLSAEDTTRKADVPASLSRSVRELCVAVWKKRQDAITAEDLEKARAAARRQWSAFGFSL